MELEAIQTLAKRAFENKDYGKAKQYYEMVLLENPNDWEAIFNVAYSETAEGTLETLEELVPKFTAAVRTLIGLIAEGKQSANEKGIMIGKIYYGTSSLVTDIRRSVSSYKTRFGDNFHDLGLVQNWHSDIDSILIKLGSAIREKFAGAKDIEMYAARFWNDYAKGEYERHGKKAFEYPNVQWCITEGRKIDPSFFADVEEREREIAERAERRREAKAERREQARVERADREQEEARRKEEERLERLAKEQAEKNRPIAEVVAELEGASVIKTGFFKNYVHCKDLISITIPDSVTTIAQGAFAGCENLEEIIFSENSNVASIGRGTFVGLESLKTVVFGGRDLKIEDLGFSDCKALELLDFSRITDSLHIGYGVFSRCDALKKVIFGGRTLSLGNCFSGCSVLEFVDFSRITDSVYIGGSAFAECKLLGDITINAKTVVGIEGGAFYGCAKLSKIIISPTTIVEHIGSQAFYKSGVAEQTINVKKLNSKFSQGYSKKWIVPLDCEIVGGSSLPIGVIRKDFSKMKQSTGEKKGFFAMIKGLFK